MKLDQNVTAALINKTSIWLIPCFPDEIKFHANDKRFFIICNRWTISTTCCLNCMKYSLKLYVLLKNNDSFYLIFNLLWGFESKSTSKTCNLKVNGNKLALIRCKNAFFKKRSETFKKGFLKFWQNRSSSRTKKRKLVTVTNGLITQVLK